MSIEDIKKKLKEASIEIIQEERLGNSTGYQIRLLNGAIVNIYDNGTCNVQGKNTETIKTLLGLSLGALKQTHGSTPPSREIFVVYGHDDDTRNQLEVMLRRWKLEPLILDQLPSEGQTIIEKLEKYTTKVAFAVVLATPDDEGHRSGHPDEKAFRSRQNVVLELGMLLSRLGRTRVAILLKDPGKMERPSDIQGLIYISFKENLQKEAGPALAKEMAAAGYEIDIKNL